MNDRKFSRHLGKITEPHPLPLIQASMDVSRLAAGPIRGGGGPGIFTGFMSSLTIDPPVGGFAAGDILAQIPDAVGLATVVAVKVPDTQFLFAPGHWIVSGNITAPTTAGTGYFLAFFEFDIDKQLVYAMGGGPGSPTPAIQVITRTATSPPTFFQFPLYAVRPWQVRVIAATALTDAQLGNIQAVFSAVHLLDDHASSL